MVFSQRNDAKNIPRLPSPVRAYEEGVSPDIQYRVEKDSDKDPVDEVKTPVDDTASEAEQDVEAETQSERDDESSENYIISEGDDVNDEYSDCQEDEFDYDGDSELEPEREVAWRTELKLKRERNSKRNTTERCVPDIGGRDGDEDNDRNMKRLRR